MRFLPPAGSSFLKAYKLIISFLPFPCEKEKTMHAAWFSSFLVVPRGVEPLISA